MGEVVLRLTTGEANALVKAAKAGLVRGAGSRAQVLAAITSAEAQIVTATDKGGNA